MNPNEFESPVPAPVHANLGDDPEMNMSAEPQSFGPFTITLPPKQGGPRQFLLTEASEKAHTTYRNVTRRAMRMSMSEKTEERRAQIEGGEEADATLVAACLFEVMVNPSNPRDFSFKSVDPASGQPNSMSVGFVMGLPRRITKRLYDKVRVLSAMDEDEETVDFLRKRIESDQKKVARLTEAGPAGKGGPSSTQLTSG